MHNLAMSLDGYAAGPDQDLDNPLGVEARAGGERLLDRLEGGPHGDECVERVSSGAVAHFRLARAAVGPGLRPGGIRPG